MRIPDNEYHRLARVNFIYADSLSILDLYEIKNDSAYLHYDSSATDILLEPNILLKDYLSRKYVRDTKLTNKIKLEQKSRRSNLIDVLGTFSSSRSLNKNDLEFLFNSHFSYEQLIIDKTFSEELFEEVLSGIFSSEDTKKIFSESLIPYDGRTFFEESNIIRLKHLGYCLEKKSQVYKNYDFDWFRERSLTRHRLLDILSNYEEIVQKVSFEVEEIKEVFNINSVEDIFSSIKNIRYKQLYRRDKVQNLYANLASKNEGLSNFLELMKIGLRYNEDVRLLRSRSFDIFSRFAIANGCLPNELYKEFQENRLKKFAQEYRFDSYEYIMERGYLNYLKI